MGMLFLMTHPDFFWRDAVVRVDDERAAGDGAGLPDLGSDQDADGAEQLELGLEDAAPGEETVQEVHGQAEHLGLAVLLVDHLRKKVKKCQNMSKNVKKCQKMSKNVKKCQKYQ